MIYMKFCNVLCSGKTRYIVQLASLQHEKRTNFNYFGIAKLLFQRSEICYSVSMNLNGSHATSETLGTEHSSLSV